MGGIINDVLGDSASAILPIVGGVGGFLLGGPMGAMAGAGLGSAFAGMGEADAQQQAMQRAYDAQAQGTDKAVALQKYMFDLQRSDLAPARESYYRLLPQAEKMATDYTASPLYNLQLGEGTKALDRVAAARGLYNSGAAMENQRRFVQNLTATEADKKWDRLHNLMTGGSGSVSQGVGAAGQYGANVGNLYTQGGQNAANLAIGQQQARSGLYQGMSQLPFNAFNAYSMYKAFNPSSAMMQPSGGGVSFMPDVNRFSLGGYGG